MEADATEPTEAAETSGSMGTGTADIMVGMECGDLFISGGTEGTDWTYTGIVLNVINGGSYIITMADGVTSTDTDSIKVTAESDVEITLVDVDIESSTTSPFEIDAEGDVTILLSGENKLTSSKYSYADLQKTSEDNTLIITSASGNDSTEGSLTATGKNAGAGIGGGYYGNGSNITISGGTVTATGGDNGAGIGGGDGGNGQQYHYRWWSSHSNR